MKNRKEVEKHILSIIFVSIFLVLSTVLVYFPKQENLASSLAFLKTKNLFYLEDLSSGILLKNASCVKDETGLQQEPYQFKIVNRSNHDISYQILFHIDKEEIESLGKEALANKYLRYTLKEGTKEYLEPHNLTEDGILYTAVIPKQSETVFSFKMWLDYNADNDAMGKVLIGNIQIERIG